MVSGFIRKKNLKTDTDMLEAAIKDEQLQLDTHLTLEPTGYVVDEIITDSGAEDDDDIEENRSDGEEAEQSNEGKYLSKSVRNHLGERFAKLN